MSITNRRDRSKFGVAAAWQTALGSPASTSNAKFFVATSAKIDRGQIYIDPQGTTGSMFKIDKQREVAKRPRANLTVWGAKEFLPLFLESAMMGQPTASPTAASGGSNFSNFTLTGVRPGYNTEYTSLNGARVYLKGLDETPSAGQYTVEIYSDSAMTQLVASGSGSDPATITLSEQNNSGLSGSIDVTGGAGSENVTYDVGTVTLNWASTPSRYFTLWLDDGVKLQTLSDCVVKNIQVSSADEGPVEATLEVWGTTFTIGNSTLSPLISPGMSTYAHQDLTFRTDVDGTPVIESPTRLQWTIDNDLGDPLATGIKPKLIFNKIHDVTVEADFEPSDEFETLVATGEGGIWDKIDATYTLSSKQLVATWPRAQIFQQNSVEYQTDDVAASTISWVCREELGTSNTAMQITYQP